MIVNIINLIYYYFIFILFSNIKFFDNNNVIMIFYIYSGCYWRCGRVSVSLFMRIGHIHMFYIW